MDRWTGSQPDDSWLANQLDEHKSLHRSICYLFGSEMVGTAKKPDNLFCLKWLRQNWVSPMICFFQWWLLSFAATILVSTIIWYMYLKWCNGLCVSVTPRAISVRVWYFWQVQPSWTGLWGRGHIKACTLVLWVGAYAVGFQPICVKPQVLQKCLQGIYRTTLPGRRWISSWRKDEAWRQKPGSSGNPWANGHHLNHDHHYFWNMECQDHVWSWKDYTSCCKNEELYSDHPWNQWEKADRFLSAEVCLRGVAAAFRPWRRQCTTHPGSDPDAV